MLSKYDEDSDIESVISQNFHYYEQMYREEGKLQKKNIFTPTSSNKKTQFRDLPPIFYEDERGEINERNEKDNVVEEVRQFDDACGVIDKKEEKKVYNTKEMFTQNNYDNNVKKSPNNRYSATNKNLKDSSIVKQESRNQYECQSPKAVKSDNLYQTNYSDRVDQLDQLNSPKTLKQKKSSLELIKSSENINDGAELKKMIGNVVSNVAESIDKLQKSPSPRKSKENKVLSAISAKEEHPKEFVSPRFFNSNTKKQAEKHTEDTLNSGKCHSPKVYKKIISPKKEINQGSYVELHNKKAEFQKAVEIIRKTNSPEEKKPIEEVRNLHILKKKDDFKVKNNETNSNDDNSVTLPLPIKDYQVLKTRQTEPSNEKAKTEDRLTEKKNPYKPSVKSVQPKPKRILLEKAEKEKDQQSPRKEKYILPKESDEVIQDVRYSPKKNEEPNFKPPIEAKYKEDYESKLEASTKRIHDDTLKLFHDSVSSMKKTIEEKRDEIKQQLTSEMNQLWEDSYLKLENDLKHNERERRKSLLEKSIYFKLKPEVEEKIRTNDYKAIEGKIRSEVYEKVVEEVQKQKEEELTNFRAKLRNYANNKTEKLERTVYEKCSKDYEKKLSQSLERKEKELKASFFKKIQEIKVKLEEKYRRELEEKKKELQKETQEIKNKLYHDKCKEKIEMMKLSAKNKELQLIEQRNLEKAEKIEKTLYLMESMQMEKSLLMNSNSNSDHSYQQAHKSKSGTNSRKGKNNENFLGRRQDERPLNNEEEIVDYYQTGSKNPNFASFGQLDFAFSPQKQAGEQEIERNSLNGSSTNLSKNNYFSPQNHSKNRIQQVLNSPNIFEVNRRLKEFTSNNLIPDRYNPMLMNNSKKPEISLILKEEDQQRTTTLLDDLNAIKTLHLKDKFDTFRFGGKKVTDNNTIQEEKTQVTSPIGSRKNTGNLKDNTNQYKSTQPITQRNPIPVKSSISRIGSPFSQTDKVFAPFSPLTKKDDGQKENQEKHCRHEKPAKHINDLTDYPKTTKTSKSKSNFYTIKPKEDDLFSIEKKIVTDSLEVDVNFPTTMREFGGFLLKKIESEQKFKVFFESNLKKYKKHISESFQKVKQTDHGLVEYLFELWNKISLSFENRIKILKKIVQMKPFEVYNYVDKETEVLSNFYKESSEIYDLIEEREKLKIKLQVKLNKGELKHFERIFFKDYSIKLYRKIKVFNDSHEIKIHWRGVFYEILLNYESWFYSQKSIFTEEI